MSEWLPTENELLAIVAMANAHSWAEGVEKTYILSMPENPEVLVIKGASGDRIVWVEITDNVPMFLYRGYVSSTGNAAETVAEIFEISDRL